MGEFGHISVSGFDWLWFAVFNPEPQVGDGCRVYHKVPVKIISGLY
jgi:hypothetical protein